MKTTNVQRAIFSEHFEPRTDGGLDFKVQDHLHQIRQAGQIGVSDQELANAMGRPVGYVLALKATMK